MQQSDSPVRKVIVWRAAIFPRGHEQHIRVRTREVSLTAISVLSDHPLPDKMPCRLVLEVPTEDRSSCEYVELNASVAYATLIGGSSAYRISLRLTDLPAPTQELLRARLAS